MSNNFLWAFYVSGLALVAGFVLAAPGIFLLHRNDTLNVLWTTGALALAIAAWWCAYVLGLGAQCPFNTLELFALAATYVLAVYAVLILKRRFRRPDVLPSALVAVCLIAVALLRLLTPTIGE
jgi:hypothetical protein